MPDNFVCGKCGKVAKTKQALERHAAYHEDDRPFSCEVCLQRFKNSDDRGKHYRRLKRDGKFHIACTVCHKHFKSNEILRKHIEMLGCNVTPVDQNVNSKSEPLGLDNDIEKGSAISLKEEYVLGECITCTCKVCETVFSSTMLLKKHYKEVHNDTKRQVCIQCGQTLSSKDSLARHFSIFHQSSFPYSCDLCDQKFKIKESLCRHVKFVHQDGGYQCNECHRVFSQPVNLRKHSAVHSSQKQFTCKSCGREFRWKQALQKHELLHETQGLAGKTDKILNNSISSQGDLSGSLKQTVDTPIDIEDDNTLDVTDEMFNDINDHSDTFRETAQGDVIQDKTSCELKSSNHNNKVVRTDNPVNSCVKKSQFLPVSSSHGINDAVRKGYKSRQGNGDEYDFCDTDDESSFKDDINHIESRKRFGLSYGIKCIENKKAKLVDKTKDNDETFSKVEGIEISCENYVSSSLKDVSERAGKHINIMSENIKVNITERADLNNDEINLETSENMNELVDSQVDNSSDDEGTEEKNSDREKRKSGSELNEEILNCDVGLKKFKFAALTSFPTDKTKDAPKLLFKPSSIQNIMSGPAKAKLNESYTSDEKSDEESRTNYRTEGLKLTSAFSSVYTKLHNPFIIPNTSHKTSQDYPNKTVESENHKEAVVKGLKGLTKTFSAPKEQIIPSGKFSLVKHMLSLQNEDNFDKAIFENPLYNKPAHIKDFELMVERHRVTDKSDDTIVQSYDLSAKQNIPFNWLGMSVAKRRVSIERAKKDEAIDNKKSNKSELEQESTVSENKTKTEDKNILNDPDHNFVPSSKVNTDKDLNVLKNVEEPKMAYDKDNEHKSSPFLGQTHVSRGYQAMKNLVANRQLVDRNDNISQSDTSKSVLTNPFDYENKYFQDNSGERVGEKGVDTFLKLPGCSINQNTAHKAKPSTILNTTASSNKPVLHGNRDFDSHLSDDEIGVSRQFFLQQPVETRSESSVSRPSLTNSKFIIQTHPRTLSESQVMRESVSRLYPFSRSMSIPSSQAVSNSSIQPQNKWGSDPCFVSKKQLHQDSYSTVSTTSLTPMFSSVWQTAINTTSSKREIKCNKQLTTKAGSIANDSDNERPYGIRPDKRIDLAMISKNFAQLQKLNHGRLNENDMTVAFKHQHNILSSNIYHNASEPDQKANNFESSILKSSQFGGSRNYNPNVPINKSTGGELYEEGVFDAYSMVHSPKRSCGSHSIDDGIKHNHMTGSQTKSTVAEHVPNMCHRSKQLEKIHSSVKNGTEDVNMGVISAFEKGKPIHCKPVHSSYSRHMSHDNESKAGISIFDILKSHEEKGKEYDNVDSILGAYI